MLIDCYRAFLICNISTVFIVLFIHIAFKQIILPAFNVQEGSVKEVLSVPFQQTARYIIKHEEELTEKEIQIIDQILPYESLKEKYISTYSDFIKNMFKYPSEQQLKEYLLLWFKHFAKDPLCYIEVALNHCFGYFYPEYINDSLGSLQFYIRGSTIGEIDLNIFYVFSNEIRDVLSKYSYIWIKILILSFLMYPDTYTWILLFVTGTLISKKNRKSSMVCFPLFLITGVCALSP